MRIDFINKMQHIHSPIMLYEGCHLLHTVALRYSLEGGIGVPIQKVKYRNS